VGDERAAAGEMDEEIFAAGFDMGDGLAYEGRVVVEARELGEGGAEGCDSAALEGSGKGAGGAIEGVSFGHCFFSI
jgi:hypothetical protein